MRRIRIGLAAARRKTRCARTIVLRRPSNRLAIIKITVIEAKITGTVGRPLHATCRNQAQAGM